MRATSRGVILLALAALALGAPVIGVTGYLDVLDAELSVRASALDAAAAGGDHAAGKAAKQVAKLRKSLAKPKVAKAYWLEVLGAAKAASSIAKRLPGESTLPPLLEDAADAYAGDVQRARAQLADDAAALEGKAAKKAAKTLARADKEIGKAAAATVLSKQLKALTKAAKLLAPEPYVDDGGGGDGPKRYPVSLAASGTGRFLYVACRGDVPFGGSEPGLVRQMAYDASGNLTDLAPATVDVGETPLSIVAHPSAPYVYVAVFGTNEVRQLEIGQDGTLTPLSPAAVTIPNGDNPAALAIAPEGTFLFVLSSAPGGAPLTSFPIHPDGTLGSAAGVDYASPFPTAIVAGAYDAQRASRRVFTASRYRSSFANPEVRIFDVDAAGAVTSLGTARAEAHALALTPSENVLFTAELTVGPPGGTPELLAFAVQSTSPWFDRRPDRRDLPSAGPADSSLAMTADGPYLYVGCQSAGRIAQFSVSGSEAAPLSPADVPATDVSALTFSPDGSLLFAARLTGSGAASHLVHVFSVGSANGKLTAH